MTRLASQRDGAPSTGAANGARRGRSAKAVFHAVSKTFGDGPDAVVALDHIDLTLHDNDLTCVVGPSGCGKTTLLNILAGFTKPTAGAVTVDGQEVQGPGRDRGVVFQQGALFTWMTVEENILFGPTCGGVLRGQAREIAQHYIKLVGLQKFAHRYPYELSGGMQQRVAIARVLANEPEVLLMDEPFGALDAQTRELMQEELKRVWRETGKTVLFITHSIDEALFLGTTIVVMTARPGRIKDAFQVDFGDRSDLISTTEPFIEAKRRVLRALREESRRAMSEEEND